MLLLCLIIEVFLWSCCEEDSAEILPGEDNIGEAANQPPAVWVIVSCYSSIQMAAESASKEGSRPINVQFAFKIKISYY